MASEQPLVARLWPNPHWRKDGPALARGHAVAVSELPPQAATELPELATCGAAAQLAQGAGSGVGGWGEGGVGEIQGGGGVRGWIWAAATCSDTRPTPPPLLPPDSLASETEQARLASGSGDRGPFPHGDLHACTPARVFFCQGPASLAPPPMLVPPPPPCFAPDMSPTQTAS